MRIDKILKEYMDIQCQHEEKGETLPETIKSIYEEKLFIGEVWRFLNRSADGNAISKSGWQRINQICEEENSNSDSKNLVVAELRKLQREFLLESESLLKDGYTLTKEGRKRLRKCCDVIGELYRTSFEKDKRDK